LKLPCLVSEYGNSKGLLELKGEEAPTMGGRAQVIVNNAYKILPWADDQLVS
jgi:hypothetical protein